MDLVELTDVVEDNLEEFVGELREAINLGRKKGDQNGSRGSRTAREAYLRNLGTFIALLHIPTVSS